MYFLQISMPFPAGRLVYDFKLDDGGVSKSMANVDDMEEEERDLPPRYLSHGYNLSEPC